MTVILRRQPCLSFPHGGLVLPDANLAEGVVGQVDVADDRVLQEALADDEAGSWVDGVAAKTQRLMQTITRRAKPCRVRVDRWRKSTITLCGSEKLFLGDNMCMSFHSCILDVVVAAEEPRGTSGGKSS